MKVLFIAAEVSPIAKVGGLADVVGSLPRILNIMGHDVRVAIPKYGFINNSSVGMLDYLDNLPIAIDGDSILFSVKVTEINGGTTCYLLENDTFFGSDDIYTINDAERFYAFNKSVIQLLNRSDWRPDIIHCHDWHTGFIPMWLKKKGDNTRIVYTIHNLAYQGHFDDTFIHHVALNKEWQGWPEGAPPPQKNFLSHGIVWSDLVTTVSENYVKEILTPEYGAGLDSLLNFYQQKLIGITNGIDYNEYDPSSDFSVVANYNSSTFEKRSTNKLYLQQKADFRNDINIPLVGMVSRLTEQKGIDILIEGLDVLLETENIQLFILGKGEEKYEVVLANAAKRYPQKMILYPEINEYFASQVYAGSDMFLMPSRFEPCGLGQLIAMRYGSVPVVRHTGGLIDTVQDYEQDTQTGNGFVFKEYNAKAMINTIKRAIKVYSDKVKWEMLITRIMNLDFSWNRSARKYEEVYNTLVKNNEKGK